MLDLYFFFKSNKVFIVKGGKFLSVLVPLGLKNMGFIVVIKPFFRGPLIKLCLSNETFIGRIIGLKNSYKSGSFILYQFLNLKGLRT
mgnify:CR=1 FL=1